MRPDRRLTALVTGAARGIGREVCRQLAARGYRIVLTARTLVGARAAAAALARGGADVCPAALDVSRPESVESCAARLREERIAVDVLVNNAAIYPPGDAVRSPRATWREVLDANLLGAVWTCRAFVPGMVRRGYGRIVNVSSGSGAFAEGLEGPAAYCVSKAALNALTVKLAQAVRGDVKVNAVCPGWVRTAMGGREAPRTLEKGAETPVWLATLPANGPNGGFFRDREPIPW